MALDVEQELSQFEDAVGSDDIATAEDSLDSLQQGYEDLVAIEEVPVAQALEARDTQDLSPANREVLQEYLSEAAAAGLSRTGFLTTAAAYLSDPREVETAQVLDVTQQLKTRETALASAASSADAVLDGVSLPAKITILDTTLSDGYHLKGGAVTAAAIVGNVGDEPSGDVTVTIDAPDELGVDPAAVDLGSIEATSNQRSPTNISLDEGGSYSVTFEVDSDDGGDTAVLALAVETKGSLLSTGMTSIDDLIDEVENNTGLSQGTINSLVAKLENAQQNLEKADDFASNGRAKQCDNTITAAINILGAFLNEISALAGGGSESTDGNGTGNGKGNGTNGELSDREATTLRRSGERIIEELGAARQAEL